MLIHFFQALITSHTIRALALSFPSATRAWYVDMTNRGLKKHLEDYFIKFISPDLVQREYRLIAQYKSETSSSSAASPSGSPQKPAAPSPDPSSNIATEGSSFSIRTLRGSQQEVQATYAKDDMKVSLSLTYVFLWS